jgi:hypothetical protein
VVMKTMNAMSSAAAMVPVLFIRDPVSKPLEAGTLQPAHKNTLWPHRANHIDRRGPVKISHTTFQASHRKTMKHALPLAAPFR